MSSATTCPTTDVLQRLLHGHILDPQGESLIQHLEHCEHCVAVVRTLPTRDTLGDAEQAGAGATDFAEDDAMRPLMTRLRRLGQAEVEYATNSSPEGQPEQGRFNEEPLDFLAPAQSSQELGRLGGYRVLRVLGAGSMGVVLQAEDVKLKRRVALKVMKRGPGINESAKRRFLREAESTAAVKSDHVITIHQVGEDNGVPFLAMEFLEGLALDEWLGQPNQPSVAEVLRIGCEMAMGLAAAHERGLIHRDIKPGNVWLEKRTGRVKILDFGLARVANEDGQLTPRGGIEGTPAYMAPEQARGEEVDHRCDLFSLGSVLYRLTTGNLPFKGDTTMAILMSLVTERPQPVQQLNPNLPPRLAQLIEKLLAKDPAKRPATAQAVIEEIQAIQRETSPESVSAPRPVASPKKHSRGLLVAVALGLLVLGAAVAFGVVLFQPTPDGKVVRIECDDPDINIAFEKGEFKVIGAYKEVLVLKPGKIGLKVKKGDFEFETDKLIVNKGEKIALKIEVVQGKVQVVQEGKGVLGAKELPAVEGESRAKELPPAAKATHDRSAAEWVLSIGGKVGVSGTEPDIAAIAALPKEGFLLTSVCLIGNQKVTDAGLAHLKDCKNLTSLDLDRSLVSDSGLAHFKECKSLTILYLKNTQVGDAGLAYFKDCKKLKHLVLSGTQVSDAGLANFKDCKNLTHLDLDLTQVGDAGLAHLKDCKNLTHLHLHRTHVSDEGLAHFKGCNKLKHLELERTAVSDEGLAFFKDCKNLAYLGLSHTSVSDQGLAHFKYSKNLTHLFMNRTPVSDEGLAHLKGCKTLMCLGLQCTQVSDTGLAHLKDCKDLRELHLSETKVSDTGLAHFKDCKNLRYLGLESTQVSNAGLVHFKDCKKLGLLYLSFTQVSDAGLAHLKGCTDLWRLGLNNTQMSDEGLAYFKACKSLEELDVTKTNVSAKALAEFHAAVPACRITHDTGTIEPK